MIKEKLISLLWILAPAISIPIRLLISDTESRLWCKLLWNQISSLPTENLYLCYYLLMLVSHLCRFNLACVALLLKLKQTKDSIRIGNLAVFHINSCPMDRSNIKLIRVIERLLNDISQQISSYKASDIGGILVKNRKDFELNFDFKFKTYLWSEIFNECYSYVKFINCKKYWV